MPELWQQYQVKVADFFRTMGCEVAIEKEVVGARGVHVIDVVATRAIFGVVVTWIVECKLWRNAIPKEKVLALAQIASDIGADRAFLVSESGFQSGALRVAGCSNITLTSLEDLRESASPELARLQCEALGVAFHRLQSDMHTLFDSSDYALPAKDGESSAIDLLADVFEIKMIALPKVQSGEFPVVISGSPCVDVVSFIQAAEAAYFRVAKGLGDMRTGVLALQKAASPALHSFAQRIREFMDTSEAVLFPQDNLDRMASTMENALARMKDVGVLADELRGRLGNGLALRPVVKVMRALIEGPYLLLPNLEGDKQRWTAARRIVEKALRDLSLVID